MSVVEQPRDWTEQERLKWIKTYQGMLDTPINSWILEYDIEYKKKCCDNCEYYDKLYYSECYGNCAKHIVNESLGKFIENSDTFYCSYHKFKV